MSAMLFEASGTPPRRSGSLLATAALALGLCPVDLVAQPTASEPPDEVVTGNAGDHYRLGYAHWVGQDVEQNATEAARWFRLAAEQGHPDAQFYLGVLHAEGSGVPRSRDAAAEWFLRAAEQGHASAQFRLARNLERGRGVERDAEAALDWFSRAADQGHVDAQFTLASRYLSAGGQDLTIEAARLFRLAATQGHLEAQYNLGYMLAEGQGVARDPEEAAYWYRLAADQGHAGAQVSLGFVTATRALGSRRTPARTDRPPPDEVARDIRLNRDPRPDEARFTRGLMYRYRLAAEQGHATAQFLLGTIYERGQEVQQDRTEAVRWMRLAANQGYLDAQLALGEMLASDRGGVGDYVEAFMWLDLAAQTARGDDDRARAEHARDLLATRLTVDQVDEARQRVRRWRPGPGQPGLTR